MMASTEEEFARAVEYIQNLPKEGPYKPSTADKLKFYSLYKQATEGPCTAPKPKFYDLVGKHKWEAWMQLKDMTNEEAMTLYVEEFRRVKAAYEKAQAAHH